MSCTKVVHDEPFIHSVVCLVTGP